MIHGACSPVWVWLCPLETRMLGVISIMRFWLLLITGCVAFLSFFLSFTLPPCLLIYTPSVAQLANVHPWFANVTVDASAAWTADFFAQQDVALAANLSNKPKMYIAETGWPTVSAMVFPFGPRGRVWSILFFGNRNPPMQAMRITARRRHRYRIFRYAALSARCCGWLVNLMSCD